MQKDCALQSCAKVLLIDKTNNMSEVINFFVDLIDLGQITVSFEDASRIPLLKKTEIYLKISGCVLVVGRSVYTRLRKQTY